MVPRFYGDSYAGNALVSLPCLLSLFARKYICDMIKGNESLVENFNSFFLAPLSQNCNMLHFDPNPIIIGYLVTEL